MTTSCAATASRIATRGSIPDASARISWSSRWPAASRRSSSCASGESRSIRSISASRSVGGSEPRPSVPAASSSSANSGLPSLRANRRSSSMPSGAVPRMSVSCCAELLAGQRLELHPQRAGVALELGQQRAQRVTAVQLVRAVGGDDEHPLAAQTARQVDEERARRAIGPVQVLDRQQQPVLAREQLQQLEERVEQTGLSGGLVVDALLAAAEPGEDLGERAAGRRGERGERGVVRARQRAQGADERRVGQLALPQLDAVAADHAARPGRGRRVRARRAGGSCRPPIHRRRTPARGGRRPLRSSEARSSSSSAARPTKVVLVTRDDMRGVSRRVREAGTSTIVHRSRAPPHRTDGADIWYSVAYT